jgi:PKD repeat protein
MDRRTVLRTTAAGVIASSGITALSRGVTAEPDVVSELTLPEDGARGFGVNEDRFDVFVTTHTSGAYYLNMDGSVNGSWEPESTYHGAAISNDALYLGGYAETLTKFPTDDDKDRADRDMPDDVFALAVDDQESVLWAGGRNGRIWRMDPVTLDIQESVDFGESIFALAYDGTYLWVGDSERGYISQYDPSAGETVATYGYPNAQKIYDYAFSDGHLWLEGDGILYETDIDRSIPNDAPTASFTFSPETPEVGNTVTFDASSSTDPDGTVASYEWDLTGDGTVDATGETASTTYESTGEFRVTITVTDDVGATEEMTTVVTVTAPPTPRLSISPSNPETGEEITFSGSDSVDSDGTIESYEWDVTGDGDVDERGETVTSAYQSPGEYQVTLEVTDDDGLSAETQSQVVVESVETTTDARTTTEDGGGGTVEGGEGTDGGEDAAGEVGGDTTRPSNDEETAPQDDETGETPGFGVGGAIAGVAGAGYVLERRLGDDEADE